MRHIKTILILLIISAIINLPVAAQNTLQERHRNYISTRMKSQRTGNIRIIMDERLDNLMEKHIRISKKNDGITGWRIQLYYGLSESDALQAKADFLKKYPDLWSDVPYSAPNFRTVVGNYPNKIDAYRFYKELVKDFKSCFLIKQKIKLSELNKKNWQYFEFVEE